MHGLIEAGEQEFNVRPFALTWLVDFGVGRYYGKISDGNPAFLRNEIHQPAEADKVSQQLLDIKVIPVDPHHPAWRDEMSDAAIARASILGPRKLAALDRVDQLPREMRECVHEFGLPIVEVLTRHGIREARHIREIVREIWLGPRQEGQRNGAMNIVDFILSRGPTNSKTLRRALADNNFVIVPTHPTRAMLDASMAEVSGHNVRVTREEKHRRRLMAAIRAALSEDMK